MFLSRKFVNSCNTKQLNKLFKPMVESNIPVTTTHISFGLHQMKESRRTLSIDSTNTKQDLLVQYLDGDNSGVVVFGLNRPEAKNSFSKNLVLQL